MNKLIRDTKITIIGGGTGTYSVLTGLKKYTNKISAIVSMADSGGSAKKERDEWGLLPSSDIRKSLLALSDVSDADSIILRRLFQYRYSEGNGLTGVSFGNLFLIALTKLLGSQTKAIEKAGKILKIRGKVIPVSLDQVDLVATYEDGSIVVGEHNIDDPSHNGQLNLINLSIKPETHVNPKAEKAIKESGVIILGPGGFYTTIIANLVVKGVVEAITKSSAKKILILNLMTEYGQTYRFTAGRFLKELDKYLPLSQLDFVFFNNSPIPQLIREKYCKVHAEPVVNDILSSSSFKIISSDLLSKTPVKKEKGDILKRSLIRHDPDKIAQLCRKVLNLI